MFSAYISHHCEQNKNRNNRLLHKEIISLLYGCYWVDIFLHMRCNTTYWGHTATIRRNDVTASVMWLLGRYQDVFIQS